MIETYLNALIPGSQVQNHHKKHLYQIQAKSILIKKQRESIKNNNKKHHLHYSKIQKKGCTHCRSTKSNLNLKRYQIHNLLITQH